MILEIATIYIPAGQQAQFDLAIQRGLDEIMTQSLGYRGHEVHKGIESPERYMMMIYWDTLENHTVDFRESPAFAAWRAIVGPYFASPPNVEHFKLLTKSK